MIIVSFWIMGIPKQFDGDMDKDQYNTDKPAIIREKVFGFDHFVKFTVPNVQYT